MAEQLAASREAERDFLLSVSHELKTPLTAIRGYAEGLADGAFDADEAARTIVLEAGRLERLVRDLLDLARMNRSEFSVRSEPVDLAEIAREAVAPPRGGGARVRRRAAGRGRREPGSRATTTACCRSPRTSSRTRSARRPRGAPSPSRPAGHAVVADTGPGIADGRPPARVRALLSLRQGRARTAPSAAGSGSRSSSSSRRRWAATSGSRAARPGRRSPSSLRPQLRGVDDLEVGAREATERV